MEPIQLVRGAGQEYCPDSSRLSQVHILDPARYRFRRVLAGSIDLGLALGLVAALLMTRRLILALLLRRIFAFALPHVYLLLKDSLEGKSIGKLLAGLSVVRTDNLRPAGILESILRNWYLAIPFAGPTIFAGIITGQILFGRKRRLGERSARTAVLRDSDCEVLE